MKPLLIGEDNPTGSDPRFALYPLPRHRAGGRLCYTILGMRGRDYIREFDRRNLCATKWYAADARVEARVLDATNDYRRLFIVLGAKVSSAFDVTARDFESQRVSDRWFLRLPHPSGRSRAWNDPESIEKARAALRGFLPADVAAMIGSAGLPPP